MSERVVLYEEKGSVAIVPLKRPKKMNTLTEGLIQSVADGIDRANASNPVRSIVRRGAGPTLTGDYDPSHDDDDVGLPPGLEHPKHRRERRRRNHLAHQNRPRGPALPRRRNSRHPPTRSRPSEAP